MLKFILFVLAGAVIYVLFSYVLRLFNLSDDLIIGITSVMCQLYTRIYWISYYIRLIKRDQ